MGEQLELLEPVVDAYDFISSALPDKTYLYYVDRGDSLEYALDTVQEILDGDKTIDYLYERVWDCYTGYENLEHYEEMISTSLYRKLSKEYDDVDAIEAYVDEFMRTNEELIRDVIFSRDSTVLEDLMRNTPDVPVRITAHSNYEGIEPAYVDDRDGWRYEDGLAQAIDMLQLNPAEVKKELERQNGATVGDWPDVGTREPFVDVAKFVRELYETGMYTCELTFVGLMNLSELVDYTGVVTIPAGNCLGFFSSWRGTGSTIETPLLRPLTLFIGQYGATEHDRLAIYVDKQKRYSMDSVYGPTRAFFGDTITLK